MTETREYLDKRQSLAMFLLAMATGMTWDDAEGVDDLHANYLADAGEVLSLNPHLLSLNTREAMGQDKSALVAICPTGEVMMLSVAHLRAITAAAVGQGEEVKVTVLDDPETFDITISRGDWDHSPEQFGINIHGEMVWSREGKA